MGDVILRVLGLLVLSACVVVGLTVAAIYVLTRAIFRWMDDGSPRVDVW